MTIALWMMKGGWGGVVVANGLGLGGRGGLSISMLSGWRPSLD